MAKRSISRAASKKAHAAGPAVRLIRLPGLPEIRRGDDLAGQITDAAHKARMQLEDDDILVIAHKMISKAEGAPTHLTTISPSPQAQVIAARQKKDPPFADVIRRESRRHLRSDPELM